ncbi:RagB/SusD family nutrient uptake outer membrane protein [Flavivirga amylovorans]|uniref:RagB/SusD family nutrient uptake outer membrane protein n=1 Tax=Flavivirga amylovorans TaxID=870486 RepID=A0ABT8X112_9FLAO|nr:RagB/SusD family nutrient uptake outer membrane protein [Flavivirga amylovorans]MDO5987605.1 RagB/SusD family nutrient uptake outer membrane protein [Flavivirga amylovorans]
MKIYILVFVTISTILSCDNFLEEEVFTEIDPSTFLKDIEGVNALLTGAYSKFAISNFSGNNYFWLQEVNTDITWGSGGGVNALLLPLTEFTWDSGHPYFASQFDKFYEAIATANNVLMEIEELDNLNDAIKLQVQAEARFIRGTSYYILHGFFGPTQIIEIPKDATIDEIETIVRSTPRATESEYRDYVQSDLRFATDNLTYGGVSSRANKGSALSILTKFYLNNKQWIEASVSAEKVISEGGYDLYGDYLNLFSVNGESNNEYIFRFENLVGSNQQHVYIPLAFPPNYPIQSNWENFGAQARTYTAFFETFDLNDVRKQSFIKEYTSVTTGELILLDRDTQGNALDNVRSFKYVPDPNALGRYNGNDVPLVRLADIILAKAEALNEINGPNQESIDLINIVRNRAAVESINLFDFADKDSLRDYILEERAREFFTESLRRDDLIRHGKFIESAISRGKPAQTFHIRYPLPQEQIDLNPNLEQNDGY